MHRNSFILLIVFLFGSMSAMAQSDGDVIINKIGNSGTNKAAYTSGDFVELLVLKPEGIKLAGWYLTDLSTLTGTAKETEGRVRFSDAEGSAFRQTIPQGIHILVWLSSKDSVAEVAKHQEDIAFNDGNNRIVVFVYNSPKHMDGQEGYINLTGKDNLVLLKSWNRDGAVDAIVWGGTSKWTGCQTTGLPLEALANGAVAWFVPRTKTIPDFKDNSDPKCWKSSTDASDATPGRTNKGVDDSILIPKKE
ncbi:MAG: hypothetical protein NTZ35_04415 [Ignavibacteriales bacterium]|nr:hypothetical protein [Ignavibacteriales bacterium]